MEYLCHKLPINIIMYEFYQLGQQWQKLCIKQWEPVLNNPMTDWYMDLWIEAGLRVWFWPGALITLQDQMEEFAKTVSICRV